MFDADERSKLINAINFFVRNTRRCHTLKLFKLLHFLDFEIYRQTGFGVTGLQYKAWPNGPAPSELWHELKYEPGADLRKSVLVVQVKDDLTDELMRRDIKPIAPFDPTSFTKREMGVMQLLAEVFYEIDGKDMSFYSHHKKLPWYAVYQGGKGRGAIIPYELSRSSEPVLQNLESIPDDEYKYRKSQFGS